MTEDYQKIFLQKTFDYLTNAGQKITENDLTFIKKYQDLFRRDQVSLARKSVDKQDLQWDVPLGEEQTKKHIPVVSKTVQRKVRIRRK